MLFGQRGNVGMTKKPEDSGNEIGTVRGEKKKKKNYSFMSVGFNRARYSSWPDICVHVQVTSRCYYRYFTCRMFL